MKSHESKTSIVRMHTQMDGTAQMNLQFATESTMTATQGGSHRDQLKQIPRYVDYIPLDRVGDPMRYFGPSFQHERVNNSPYIVVKGTYASDQQLVKD